MFVAGFGLFGVGAAMAIMRTGASFGTQLAKKRFLATLEIPSRDYSYQWVMQWLISNSAKTSRHLGVETSYRKDSAGNAKTSFDYIPSPGRHWMQHKGVTVMVERERQQTALDTTVGAPFETLTLTTAAWHRAIFDEILREARDKALAKEEGRTVIYHACGHEWRPFGPPKRIRPMESVILADGVAEMLIADVEDFRRRGDWYADRGIPYRRGYLLHGPPGSGKSSFTLALAGMLRVGVAALNVGDPTLTDERCG
jgi:mitochondrial chaperone BCS1